MKQSGSVQDQAQTPLLSKTEEINTLEVREPYLRSGFIQTALVPIVKNRQFKELPQCRRQLLALRDGSNDQTDCYLALHRQGSRANAEPYVVLIHGLGGHAGSAYVSRTSYNLYKSGHDVVATNLRGAGTSAALASRLHHPGNIDDVDRIIKEIQRCDDQLHGRPYYIVAFSLGGHATLSYLGQRAKSLPEQLKGCVTVSAPIDLLGTSQQLQQWKNRVFDKFLLHKMKNEYGRPNAAITESQRRAIDGAKSVWTFDQHFTSGYLQFDSVEDYYQKLSAKNWLTEIKLPTTVIVSCDDPFVRSADYDSDGIKDNRNITKVITTDGGHVGFFEGFTKSQPRWLDRYLDWALRQ